MNQSVRTSFDSSQCFLVLLSFICINKDHFFIHSMKREKRNVVSMNRLVQLLLCKVIFIRVFVTAGNARIGALLFSELVMPVFTFHLQGAVWPLGFLMKHFSMLRNRMLADPSFLFKVGTEVR